MRTKATLFLLVLVLGLGGVAYFVRSGWSARERFKAQSTHVIDVIDADHLEIAFQDQAKPVMLERKASGWELTSPVKWPANPYAVDMLLGELQRIEKENSFPYKTGGGDAGQKLSDYGLDPPRGTLVCVRRGERQTLEIGATSEIGNRLYVRGDDKERIYVVSQSLLSALTQPIENLRSNAVFSLPTFEIRSWNVQVQLNPTANLRVWLSRDGDDWRLDTPVRARADKGAVETLLEKILGMEVAAFVPPETVDMAALGAAPEPFPIRVTVEGAGRREALAILRPADTPETYYAQREDTAASGPVTLFTVTLDTDTVEKLRGIQLGLRDRHVVDLDPAALQSITIVPAGGTSITLQRVEATDMQVNRRELSPRWQVFSRDPARGMVAQIADTPLVRRIVDEIQALRAAPGTQGFVRDAPSAADLEGFGLTLPAWQVVLNERIGTDADARTRTRTLSLGASPAPDSPLRYARLAEEGFVYLVDRALADDLSAQPFYYRDHQLQLLQGNARITAVSLKRLGDGQAVFSAALTSPEQTWEAALAEQQPEALRTAALALVGRLRDLRARSIVAPEFSPVVPGATDSRAWTWLLEATISQEGTAAEQATTFKVHLDRYAGGTDLLGASIDLNLVFAADQDFIDAVTPLMGMRPDPGPPDSDPHDAPEQPASDATQPTGGTEEAAPAESPDAAPAAADTTVPPTDSASPSAPSP